MRISLTPSDAALVAQAAELDELGVLEWARGVLLRQARRRLARMPEGDVRPGPDARASEAERIDRELDAALAVLPRLTDPQVAARCGVTVDVARRRREARGVAPVAQTGPRSDWRELVGGWRARGLTVDQMVDEPGCRWSRRTLQEYVSRLRRANAE